MATLPDHKTSSVFPVVEMQDLDITGFKELRAIRNMHFHQYLNPQTQVPVYTIIEHETPFQRCKPDIQLFAGASKTSPLVGVVKLHSVHSRKHTIGLGDQDSPDPALARMEWEGLLRTEKWKYRTYTFEYGLGEARKVYTWRRTKVEWLKYLKEMELRAGDEKTDEGELLAVWKSNSNLSGKRGMLFVKESGGENRNGSVSRIEERKKWEWMVLLTSLAIIEATIRRHS